MSNLDADLATLLSRELILRTGSRDEREYSFKHALTQAAGYQTLLKKRRRELHGRVALALQQLYPDRTDELAALIAHHFERAEDWPNAVAWLHRAADRAYAAFSLQEAVSLYRRALAALARLPADIDREFELRLHLAHCLGLVGETPEIITAEFERCLELAHDGEQRARAHIRFGEMLHIFTRSDLDAAKDHFRQAVNAIDASENLELRGRALGHLGYVYRYTGHPARSAEILERALDLARESSSPTLLADTLIFISGAYLDLGREEEALKAAEEGLQIAQDVGNLDLIGKGHSFLGDIFLSRAEDDPSSADDALHHIQEM